MKIANDETKKKKYYLNFGTRWRPYPQNLHNFSRFRPLMGAALASELADNLLPLYLEYSGLLLVSCCWNPEGYQRLSYPVP